MTHLTSDSGPSFPIPGPPGPPGPSSHRPSGNLHHRQIDASALRQALHTDPVALHREAGAHGDPRCFVVAFGGEKCGNRKPRVFDHQKLQDFLGVQRSSSEIDGDFHVNHPKMKLF